jgi:hypothetical protein
VSADDLTYGQAKLSEPSTRNNVENVEGESKATALCAVLAWFADWLTTVEDSHGRNANKVFAAVNEVVDTKRCCAGQVLRMRRAGV